MIKKLLLFLLLIALSYPVEAGMRFLEVPQSEIKCFADNLYYEARGEPIEGIVLVGEAVMSRMEDRRWPSTACKVVYQKKQFSWTNSTAYEIDDISTYNTLYELSSVMLSQRLLEERQEVNHYLRCDIKDKVNWWKSMEFFGKVGDHCFYYDR